MFVVRRAKVDDAGTMLKLARMVHFINLPPDSDIINRKIVQSRSSFMRVAKGEPLPEPVRSLAGGAAGKSAGGGLDEALAETNVFMFVLEDTESRGVLGTSQVIARMGGPGRPNWSFKLHKQHFFSDDIHAGTTHVTATLYGDESGPSEIGGLILQPSYRGHKQKLGRFLSLIRFHFMALHRELFADEVLAEMMAPISNEGENLLWNALGRRFIPLSYSEADRHCQISRDFIANLLPREPIYLTLLPPAARDVVGKVGAETVPARRMLEKLGFEYRDFVDPFDGGPHLHAKTDSIQTVQATHRGELGPTIARSKCDTRGIVSFMDTDGDFRAVDEQFAVDAEGVVSLPKDVMTALVAEPGASVGYTVLSKPDRSSADTKREPAKKKSRTRNARKAAR
ncbi:MAG: hypothetical protein EA378_10960 [Phycisphaerales bacterium]|nr:MAG: hypothetical protein EA378_10960 [Phycisphaerales bacterium]